MSNESGFRLIVYIQKPIFRIVNDIPSNSIQFVIITHNPFVIIPLPYPKKFHSADGVDAFGGDGFKPGNERPQ